MENFETTLISEKIIQTAAILIPALGLIALISGVALFILKKKNDAFKESRPVRKMSIYLIAAGIILLIASLVIVIGFMPYLNAAQNAF